MNPLGVLALIYLIARYLKESGDPSCERVGERMEQDVEDLLSGAWRLVEGCVLGACLLAIAIGVVAMVVRVVGWVLGLR